MKKYIKKIIISCAMLCCAFYFFNKSSGAEKPKVSKIPTVKLKSKVEPKIVVAYHPKETTKTVHLKLDSLLKRINKRNDFHGAILVGKNGKIVYRNQVGFADFRKKIPLNETSVFQLASVSKQFTAAAIMLLIEQHKIKLSDTVNKYFPKFPFENITIKNLLNHTAGLPKYFWVAEHEWKQKNAPTNTDMMALLEESKVQRFFKPGQNFDYSNTGYFVLASIVEKVSGTSFSTFLEDKIFKPLQMKNSFVYSSEIDNVKKDKLDGFRLYRGWRHLKIGSTVNDAIVGDKNVYSNIEDLFKWTQGLNTGKLLTQESLDLMYAKGKTIYGREVPYGFGFRINDKKEQRSVYHYGKWNGFSTAITKYLKDDLVIIILEHTSYNGISTLNKKIENIVSENFIP